MAEEESDSSVTYSDADVARKTKFFTSCRELREKVAAVESIQIDILITLLTSADANSEVNLDWANDICKVYPRFLAECCRSNSSWVFMCFLYLVFLFIIYQSIVNF